MSKMHYDPFYTSHDPYGENNSEFGYCGTLLSETEDNSTNNKEYVDCKKCIKKFDQAKKEMQMHSDNFANDCQLLNEFITTKT